MMHRIGLISRLHGDALSVPSAAQVTESALPLEVEPIEALANIGEGLGGGVAGPTGSNPSCG